MSKQVEHFMQLMPKQMTIGDLKRAIRKLKIPDSAIIKSAQGDQWRWIMQFSYCRLADEVSLW